MNIATKKQKLSIALILFVGIVQYTMAPLFGQKRYEERQSNYYQSNDERENGIVGLDFSIKYTTTYLEKERKIRFRVVYTPIKVFPEQGYRYNGVVYGAEVEGLIEAMNKTKVIFPTVVIGVWSGFTGYPIHKEKVLLSYTTGGFAMSDEIYLEDIDERNWNNNSYSLSIESLNEVQYGSSHTYITFERLIDKHLSLNKGLENFTLKLKEGISLYNRKKYTEAKESLSNAKSIYYNLSGSHKEKADIKKIDKYLTSIEQEEKREQEEKKKQEEKEEKEESKDQEEKHQEDNDEETISNDMEKDQKKEEAQREEEEYDHHKWCFKLQSSISSYYQRYRTDMRNDEVRESIIHSIEQLNSSCPTYITEDIEQIYTELTSDWEALTAKASSLASQQQIKASEKKLAEQQRMENKRAGLDSKRAERQKQYDDWVSNARERQTIYETEAMASMAAFMYLTGTIMYKGMGIPNKDPYTVYTPQMGVTKFYVGIDLGYSGTMMPLLHPSKIVKMENGNPIEQKEIKGATLYTINLDPKIKIGAESDFFSGYAFLNPQFGVSPTINGLNTSFLNYGAQIALGIRNAKIFGEYERGNRSYQWSSREVEEVGRAKINAKFQKIFVGLRFSTNPNYDYKRTHFYIGAIYERIDVHNEFGRIDNEFALYNPATSQVEIDAESESILGYTFQVKKDHTFQLFINVYPKYWYGGQLPEFFPRVYSKELTEKKTSPMIQIGFLRSLDWFF